jgi:hypothetical protein
MLLLYGRGQSLEGPQLDRLGWPHRVLRRVRGALRNVSVVDERYRGLLTAHDPYTDSILTLT